MRALVFSAVLLFALPARAEDKTLQDVGTTTWVLGATTLGASWLATGATATATVLVADSRKETIAESWVPIVGPWLMLADSAGFDRGQMAATLVSGIVQAAATVAIVTGLVLHSSARAPERTGAVNVRLGPIPLSGTF